MRLRKPTTRIASTVAVSAILAAASLASASATGAADRRTLTADALATWQTNGVVWAMAYANGVVYVGGTFDHVRPPGAEPGEGEVRRINFAAFDATSGRLLPCAPPFLGRDGATVRALEASPDGKVLYVGGSFGRVGRIGVANAVAFNTADCSLRKGFRPTVTATVRAIEATDRTVYLGGDFGSVNGRRRPHIASLSPQGALLPFSVYLDAPVRTILAAPRHRGLIVGGDFHWVEDRRSHALVSLDPATGRPVRTYDWVPFTSQVKTLVQDGTNFYLGAEGNGTGWFDGRIAGRLSDDRMLWRDDCLGATQALVAHNGVLYSATHAHDCSTTPGGFPDGRRQHFLAQSTSDKSILHWFPDTDDGIGEEVGPRAMVMAKGILWAGGEFTTVNGRPQQGLTRFAAGPDTGAPRPPALSVFSERPGRVTLTWRASWDRDDAVLTYRIYRDTKYLASVTQRSAFWHRPELHYTDSVAPGSRHQYSIRVTDGKNISLRSERVGVRAAW